MIMYNNILTRGSFISNKGTFGILIVNNFIKWGCERSDIYVTPLRTTLLWQLETRT